MIHVSKPTVLNVILEWEPPKAPHCSNCRFALVSGDPNEPVASCAQGHGPSSISLWRLIRSKSPRGFRSAEKCPDFSIMSDEP